MPCKKPDRECVCEVQAGLTNANAEFSAPGYRGWDVGYFALDPTVQSALGVPVAARGSLQVVARSGQGLSWRRSGGCFGTGGRCCTATTAAMQTA